MTPLPTRAAAILAALALACGSPKDSATAREPFECDPDYTASEAVHDLTRARRRCETLCNTGRIQKAVARDAADAAQAAYDAVACPEAEAAFDPCELGACVVWSDIATDLVRDGANAEDGFDCVSLCTVPQCSAWADLAAACGDGR